MQRQWVGKNVKLALLSEHIENFLKRKGFRTSRKEQNKEYKISAGPEDSRGSLQEIVRIYGSPNDFVLEFAPVERARLSKMFGSLTSLFGGGSIILRDLQSEEIFGKLEEEFWLFAEDIVPQLAGSATQ